MYLAAAIDIVNLTFFFLLGIVSILNIRLLWGRKETIFKMLLLHSSAALVMSAFFLVLQLEWSISNHGAGFKDWINLGWSLFETITSLSLLSYAAAIRVFTQINDKFACKAEKVMKCQI